MLLLDEIASKTVKRKEIMIDRSRGSKILKGGNLVSNLNKNPQSYIIINMQNEVLLSHKL